MLLQLSQFFSLCPPPLRTPHSLRLLCSLFCTSYSHDYSVTTNFYILIPSPFWPSLPMPPSNNHQNVLCIYDSVSALLECLFCFLDSAVNSLVQVTSYAFWPRNSQVPPFPHSAPPLASSCPCHHSLGSSLFYQESSKTFIFTGVPLPLGFRKPFQD
ncbi:hypothetical protein HJG60_008307 [Phyllostomus discolor]|uniref:Uncharacterized protein n=1 Tax=Phyllostomus discolor TaxID=89673 RepID=A0A833Z452_9CHIR|nr:hypothetical protein HJG60_008307 [Phyllostomus discolor]